MSLTPCLRAVSFVHDSHRFLGRVCALTMASPNSGVSGVSDTTVAYNLFHVSPSYYTIHLFFMFGGAYICICDSYAVALLYDTIRVVGGMSPVQISRVILTIYIAKMNSFSTFVANSLQTLFYKSKYLSQYINYDGVTCAS